MTKKRGEGGDMLMELLVVREEGEWGVGGVGWLAGVVCIHLICRMFTTWSVFTAEIV